MQSPFRRFVYLVTGSMMLLLFVGMLVTTQAQSDGDRLPPVTVESTLQTHDERGEPTEVISDEPTATAMPPGLDLIPFSTMPPEVGATLFVDDFESGLSKWVASPGVTIVADETGNQAAQMPGGSTMTPINLPALETYKATIWFNLTDDSQDALGALDLNFANGYALNTSPASTTLSANGQEMAVAVNDMARSATTWTQLEVLVYPNGITVRVNGAPLINTPAQTASGPFSISAAEGVSIRVDDVLLEATNTIPLRPTMTPVVEAQYDPDKISGELVNLLEARETSGLRGLDAPQADQYQLDRDNKERIPVVLWAREGKNGNNLVNLIEDADGKVERVDYQRVYARLSLDAIAELSLHNRVSVILLQERFSAGDVQTAEIDRAFRVNRAPVGGAETEGFDIVGAQTWHNAGFVGGDEGGQVQVAIIDVGFGTATTVSNNYECLSSFPNVTLELGIQVAGDTVRGLDMTEVVCDIAPSSEVKLYKATTLADLFDAITDASLTSDVIVIGVDLGASASPGDGVLGYTSITDPYAAIANAVNTDVTVIATAGNNGQNYETFGYIGGTTTLAISAPPGESVHISWNDWDNNPQTGIADITAQLSGAGFTAINKPARGSGNPGHQFNIPTNCTASGGLCSMTLTISGLSGATEITVQVQATGLSSTVADPSAGIPMADAGTIARPGDSSNVITVGAVCASPFSNFPQLDYSSRGPVYDAGGNFSSLPAGDFFTRNQVKPDIVSPSQVSTSNSFVNDQLACNEGFGGSEASAAHVAGMVALMLDNEANTAFQSGDIPGNVRHYLQTHAADMPFGATADGYDMEFGAGMAVLGAPNYDYQGVLNTNSSSFVQPNRLPEASCTGELLFVGPYNIDSSTMDGTITRPFTHPALAISQAAETPDSCVVVLPGEYATPLHIADLTNPVGIFAYASVVRLAADASIFHTQNNFQGPEDAGFDFEGAGIYVEGETQITIQGFKFEQGDIYSPTAFPGRVLVVDSSTEILFNNNTANGFELIEPMVQVFRASEGITISNNTFNENVSAGNPLIVIEDAGTDTARILFERNTLTGNSNVLGSYTVNDLPDDSTAIITWMPVLKTLDSYTDINNNTFLSNTAETVVQALTRANVAPFETRVLGNVFVDNTTLTADGGNSGPLVNLWNMQKIYFINNTVGRNDLSASTGNYGAIILRGDGDDLTNNGSLGSTEARWEIQGNFMLDNEAPAGLVDDPLGAVGCFDLTTETEDFGAQYNWVSLTGFGNANDFGVCTDSFRNLSGEAINNNIIDLDPYPREVDEETGELGDLIPGSNTYILGGEDPTVPSFYALSGFQQGSNGDPGSADQDGIDEGNQVFIDANLADFAAGFDARGVVRVNDGDQDLTAVIDLGAYELSPLTLETPILLDVDEDTGPFEVDLTENLEGGFPPFNVEVSNPPLYYGTHCDSRFTEANQGVVIEILPDNTVLAVYCPPEDFHTNSTDPDFQAVGASLEFQLQDTSFATVIGDVDYTINPIDDSALVSVLGDNSPAGDILDQAIGIGLDGSDPRNQARLRPFVSFTDNFVFSERDNTVVPAAQNEVDYDFTYVGSGVDNLPTLATDAGNVNPEFIIDNMSWSSEAQGILAFDLTDTSAPVAAQALLQYDVTDSNGNTVTNFLTVRAVTPPGPFELTTPPEGTVVGDPINFASFGWTEAINGITYDLELTRTSGDTSTTIFELTDLTAIADTDNLTCQADICTLTVTPAQQELLLTGSYSWTVTAFNEGLETLASNAPLTFTVDIGEELLYNGGFEVAGEANRLADGWKHKNLVKDKRKCNKPDKVLAFQGECMFQFKGQPVIVSKIVQAVKPPVGWPGDRLNFSAYVEAKNLTVGGRIQAVIIYETLGKQKLTLPITPGTYDYTLFEANELALEDTVSKLKAKVQIRNASGKIRVDNVSMVYRPAQEFDLIAPLNNSSTEAASVPEYIDTFRWEESGFAEVYDFTLTETAGVVTTVLDLPGLTAAADSDVLTCELNVCRLALTMEQKALLIAGTYEWTVSADTGFIAANAPFSLVLTEEGEELLVGGGLDVEGEGKAPANWTLKGNIKDKLKCDKPEKNKYSAYQGECAFLFKGRPAPYKARLDQKIEGDIIEPGSILRVRAVAQGKNVRANKAKVLLKIKFPDGTKEKVDITLPEGTYDYTEFSQDFDVLQNALSGVDSIKYRAQYKGDGGKVWVDNLSFILLPPASE